MQTIQFELGDGARVDMPVDKVARVFVPHLISSLTKSLSSDAIIPLPGQPWPEQGGIYIGSWVIDGVLRHRIIPGAPDTHIKNIKFDDIDRVVRNLGMVNGYSDWQPAQMEDLFLSFVHARRYFPSSGQESRYWTTKPYGANDAWVLGFENGNCYIWLRNYELSVLPVRSIIA